MWPPSRPSYLSIQYRLRPPFLIFWTFKAVISVPKHFFFREMTFSSLADELVTAFDNEPTTSNSLAAEFGLDLDLDQEVGLQTRAGGDGLGYRGHSLGR